MNTLAPVAKKTIGDAFLTVVVVFIFSVPIGILSVWTMQVIAGMYLPLLVPGFTLTFVQALAVRVLYFAVTSIKSAPPSSDKSFETLSRGALVWNMICSSLGANATIFVNAWVFYHLFVAKET